MLVRLRVKLGLFGSINRDIQLPCVPFVGMDIAPKTSQKANYVYARTNFKSYFCDMFMRVRITEFHYRESIKGFFALCDSVKVEGTEYSDGNKRFHQFVSHEEMVSLAEILANDGWDVSQLALTKDEYQDIVICGCRAGDSFPELSLATASE